MRYIIIALVMLAGSAYANNAIELGEAQPTGEKIEYIIVDTSSAKPVKEQDGTWGWVLGSRVRPLNAEGNSVEYGTMKDQLKAVKVVHAELVVAGNACTPPIDWDEARGDDMQTVITRAMVTKIAGILNQSAAWIEAVIQALK